MRWYISRQLHCFYAILSSMFCLLCLPKLMQYMTQVLQGDRAFVSIRVGSSSYPSGEQHTAAHQAAEYFTTVSTKDSIKGADIQITLYRYLLWRATDSWSLYNACLVGRACACGPAFVDSPWKFLARRHLLRNYIICQCSNSNQVNCARDFLGMLLRT